MGPLPPFAQKKGMPEQFNISLHFSPLIHGALFCFEDVWHFLAKMKMRVFKDEFYYLQSRAHMQIIMLRTVNLTRPFSLFPFTPPPPPPPSYLVVVVCF